MSETIDRPRLVRPGRGGRITIPVAYRRALGIGEATVLQVSIVDGEMRVRPICEDTTGSQWFRDLYDLFAPVREEIAAKGYSEAEVNSWIDEAVAAVRAERGAGANHSDDD